MAHEGALCLGPSDSLEVVAYTGSPTTGWDIAGGWFRLIRNVAGLGFFSASHAGEPAIQDYIWHCFQFINEDTGGAVEQQGRIIDFPQTTDTVQLWWERSSAGNYILLVKLANLGAEIQRSSIEIPFHATTARKIRVTRHNFAPYQVGVEVDGTLHLNIPTPGAPTNYGLILHSSDLGSATHQKYRYYYAGTGTSTDDRISDTVVIYGTHPDGIGFFDTFVGVPEAVNKHLNVDDWKVGGHDVDTYNETGIDGLTVRQTHTMDDLPGAADDDVRLVRVYLCVRTSDVNKEVPLYTLIREGGSNKQLLMAATMKSASYVSYRGAYPTRPGLGAWTEATVNDLEAGLRSKTNVLTKLRCTTVAVEVAQVAIDAGGLPPLPMRERGVLRGVLRGVQTGY